MLCDPYMCINNLKVSFVNFRKGINKLSLTLLVHWNVGKYSDLILTPVCDLVCVHHSHDILSARLSTSCNKLLHTWQSVPASQEQLPTKAGARLVLQQVQGLPQTRQAPRQLVLALPRLHSAPACYKESYVQFVEHLGERALVSSH